MGGMGKTCANSYCRWMRGRWRSRDTQKASRLAPLPCTGSANTAHVHGSGKVGKYAATLANEHIQGKKEWAEVYVLQQERTYERALQVRLCSLWHRSIRSSATGEGIRSKGCLLQAS